MVAMVSMNAIRVNVMEPSESEIYERCASQALHNSAWCLAQARQRTKNVLYMEIFTFIVGEHIFPHEPFASDNL